MVVFAAWASLMRCKRPDFANATGGDWRRIEFPLCGVYTFDADDRLAGEKNLPRPRYGVETTRHFPRAANGVGTNLHLSDSSRHNCACFRLKVSSSTSRT